MAPDTQSIDFNASFLTLGLAHALPLDNSIDPSESGGAETLSAAIKRVDLDEDDDDDEEEDEDEDDLDEEEEDEDEEEDDEEYEDDDLDDDEKEDEDDEELNLI
jgi:hypothetical protein